MSSSNPVPTVPGSNGPANIQLICRGGEKVECPLLLKRHFEVHLDEIDQEPVVEVTKCMDSRTVQNLIHLLELNHNSPETVESVFLLDVVPVASSDLLQGMDLDGFVDLFHAAHFLGLSLLSRLIAKLIYLKFVYARSPEDFLATFRRFLPTMSPATLPSVGQGVLEMLATRRERFDLEALDGDHGDKLPARSWLSSSTSQGNPFPILTDDEWVDLLIFWDSNARAAASSEYAPQYLRQLILEQRDYIESNVPIDLAMKQHTREDQIEFLSKVLTCLFKISSTQSMLASAKLKIYCIIYELLSAKSGGITRDDICCLADKLLQDLVQQGLPKLPNSPASPDSSVRDISRLATLWKKLRKAGSLLDLVCSYVPRNTGAQIRLPWTLDSLQETFRVLAAQHLQTIRASIAGVIWDSVDDVDFVEVKQLFCDMGIGLPEALNAIPRSGSSSQVATQPPQLVILIAPDGKEFEVSLDVLRGSSVLARFAQEEGFDGRLKLWEKSCASNILEKAIEFVRKHREFELAQETKEKRDAWNQSFVQVEDETLFNLILVANFLGIHNLLDLACKTVAEYIKQCKTPEEIRMRFNIPNEFTPEEEEQVRLENAWCEEAP